MMSRDRKSPGRVSFSACPGFVAESCQSSELSVSIDLSLTVSSRLRQLLQSRAHSRQEVGSTNQLVTVIGPPAEQRGQRNEALFCFGATHCRPDGREVR